MESWNVLFDVCMLLSVALVLGAICERFKQNAIIGYLLAGVVVGPETLGLASNSEQMKVLAELGVSMLLFTIGLEFSLKRLRNLGKVALWGGVLEVVVTLVVGTLLGVIFGLPIAGAIAIGAMVTPSSTACVLRILFQRAELDAVHGRNALGILLIQDIAVVPLIIIVTMLGEDGSFFEVAFGVFLTCFSVVLLFGVFYLIFNYVVPSLLGSELIAKNRELPILIAVVVAFASALGAHLAHLSPAIGAFVAGVLLAASPFATQIRSDVSSLKTILVTLFFSAVGMYADPAWLWGHLGLVFVVVVGIVLGKAFVVGWVMRFFKQSKADSLATGLCLAQVGEFSFVLATAAVGADAIDGDVFKLMISATILTLFVTPYLVAFAPEAGQWLHKIFKPARLSAEMKGLAGLDKGGENVLPRAVIVGFGPAGQAVARVIPLSNYHVCVIDLNPQNIKDASAVNLPVHIGNASHPDVLAHAGVASAELIIVTLPDPRMTRMIITQIRALNPSSQVIVRSRYARFEHVLHAAGANVVVNEEEQVGRALARHVRENLGVCES